MKSREAQRQQQPDIVDRVAARMAKPVLIYDGECGFCTFWARRWYRASGGNIEIVPLQDEQIQTRFPELSRERLEAALQFIARDGAVSQGAEAAFRGLAENPRKGLWLRYYLRWRWFARLAEVCYRFVARHRQFFSAMTRLFWR